MTPGPEKIPSRRRTGQIRLPSQMLVGIDLGAAPTGCVRDFCWSASQCARAPVAGPPLQGGAHWRRSKFETLVAKVCRLRREQRVSGLDCAHVRGTAFQQRVWGLCAKSGRQNPSYGEMPAASATRVDSSGRPGVGAANMIAVAHSLSPRDPTDGQTVGYRGA